jgi:hypothetical protein
MFQDHILPHFHYILSIIIYLIFKIYNKLFFLQQVKVEKKTLTFSKKKKIFTDNYFFYKSILSFKPSSKSQKEIDLLKNQIKSKLRTEKIKLVCNKSKFHNYFFESNYTLTQKLIKDKTLNLNLESFNKLKNFNKDLIIKDNTVFHNNQLIKQQR